MLVRTSDYNGIRHDIPVKYVLEIPRDLMVVVGTVKWEINGLFADNMLGSNGTLSGRWETTENH